MSASDLTTFYTAEEAEAQHAVHEARDAFEAAITRVKELHDKDLFHGSAQHQALLDVELTMSDVVVAEVQLLHRRLVRVFPHLADVLAFLLYTDEMPIPAGLDKAGRPKPVTNVPRQPSTRAPLVDVEALVNGR